MTNCWPTENDQLVLVRWKRGRLPIPLPLTPEQISEWVTDLAKNQGDSEAAHLLEDAIHQFVLAAIAHGQVTDTAACAKAALATVAFDFDRWYA